MTTTRLQESMYSRSLITFEDLNGLRAEGYIRDSTLDQRDGFGPEIQRNNIQRFAETYGLLMGDRCYTEFVSGRSVAKREEFQRFLEDAQVDAYDVLLVDHTSRFGRNQAECIRYKEQLQRLGKIVVFVSQGIISGSDRDFLAERINETLDEQYSRNLSRYVSAGLAEKAARGLANGVPPLGYKSEKLDSGKREQKVPDANTMPILLDLLSNYATSRYSYRTLAEQLNMRGHRTRNRRPFTPSSIENVLTNRFYEGKVVYHPDRPDEQVRDGEHEVPDEVKRLWLLCQHVKRERTRNKDGRPRSSRRAYPFSRVAVCEGCGRRYGGQPVRQKSGTVVRRLYHGRPFCGLEPHSVRVENLMAQFHEGVLPYVELDGRWRSDIIKLLTAEDEQPNDAEQIKRLDRALGNLRKQHLWSDITDEEYRDQRHRIESQLRSLAPRQPVLHLPNLERGAQLLQDLPALWVHEGVSDNQREEFVGELFTTASINGNTLVALEPKMQYGPLFAYLVANGVRKCRGEWSCGDSNPVPLQCH